MSCSLLTAGRKWIGCSEDWSGSRAPFKVKSSQQPDPSAHSRCHLSHVCKDVAALLSLRSCTAQTFINSMTLQVAFTRVGAGNRSVMWQALNLPGLLIWFFSSNSSLSMVGSVACFAIWTPASSGNQCSSCLKHFLATWPWAYPFWAVLSIACLVSLPPPSFLLCKWYYISLQTTDPVTEQSSVVTGL